MSTLTKILIVLLTLSSLFLCGIVVTYVATADNYKDKYDSLKTKFDSQSRKLKDREKELNETLAKSQRLETKLNNRIASLKNDAKKLKADLNSLEREKADLEQRVNSFIAATKGFYETNDKQRLLFENTFAELNKVKGEQIKDRKVLEETTATLVEKMAIIDRLETDVKRLFEQKVGLQNELDGYLRAGGRVAVSPKPTTRRKERVKPVERVETRDISLNGLISEVDLKNSIASISIGRADGVKEGMIFYVTRGDSFVCEILIIYVDNEEAVGELRRVQYQPQVSDTVSTNLF